MKDQQEDNPHPDSEHEQASDHPLLIWTSLSPGDVVSFRGPDGKKWGGTVESRTSDGLIIWMRDDLNDRRAFDFRECQSVRVTRQSHDWITGPMAPAALLR
ncbi:hypothetical protein [Arthrobacter sp. MMS24-S77]